MAMSGSNPLGQATASSKCISDAASISELQTLLPSPSQRPARPGQLGALLDHRLHVGQHLAGVRQVGQPVDHRHGGMCRQLLGLRVIVGADHDRIGEARQHARGIGDGLAAAELRRARLRGRSPIPPSWRIAMSKLTRVRVELFSKIIASTAPSSGASASGLPLGPAGARSPCAPSPRSRIAAMASPPASREVEEVAHAHAASGTS